MEQLCWPGCFPEGDGGLRCRSRRKARVAGDMSLYTGGDRGAAAIQGSPRETLNKFSDFHSNSG